VAAAHVAVVAQAGRRVGAVDAVVPAAVVVGRVAAGAAQVVAAVAGVAADRVVVGRGADPKVAADGAMIAAAVSATAASSSRTSLRSTASPKS
jgi:hypothetical protein